MFSGTTTVAHTDINSDGSRSKTPICSKEAPDNVWEEERCGAGGDASPDVTQAKRDVAGDVTGQGAGPDPGGWGWPGKFTAAAAKGRKQKLRDGANRAALALLLHCSKEVWGFSFVFNLLPVEGTEGGFESGEGRV